MNNKRQLVKDIQKTLDSYMADEKVKIKLKIMKKDNKNNYWAYHHSKIQKFGDETYGKCNIYLNLKDASINMIRKEVIHELRHIQEYVCKEKIEKIINKIKEEKK